MLPEINKKIDSQIAIQKKYYNQHKKRGYLYLFLIIVIVLLANILTSPDGILAGGIFFKKTQPLKQTIDRKIKQTPTLKPAVTSTPTPTPTGYRSTTD